MSFDASAVTARTSHAGQPRHRLRRSPSRGGRSAGGPASTELEDVKALARQALTVIAGILDDDEDVSQASVTTLERLRWATAVPAQATLTPTPAHEADLERIRTAPTALASRRGPHAPERQRRARRAPPLGRSGDAVRRRDRHRSRGRRRRSEPQRARPAPVPARVSRGRS